jgi:hypothetical protein
MNQDIVNSLVQAYKNKGVPMQDLLNDPVFSSLPIEKQLDAVQAYAGVLLAGSQAPKAKSLIARSAGIGAMSGAFASLPILLTSMKGPMAGVIAAKVGQMVGLSLAGAGIGSFAGYLDHLKNKKQFETTNRYLTRIKDTRGFDDSVALLSEKRRQRPFGPGPLSLPDILRQSIDKGAPYLSGKIQAQLKADKKI